MMALSCVLRYFAVMITFFAPTLTESSDFDSSRADLGYPCKYLVSSEDNLVPIKSRTVAMLLMLHFARHLTELQRQSCDRLTWKA